MASSTRYESEEVDPAPLGKPLDFLFSIRRASNRFLKAGMSERLSSWHPKNIEVRGIPSSNLINLYRRWGEGGLGMIISGNIMIEYDHLEGAGNLIITQQDDFSGQRFEAFKETAAGGKRHGSLMVGQVSHPGRQVWDRLQAHPISASDVHLQGKALGMTFAKPRAATLDEIQKVVQGFSHAAEYLEKSGWDGIELHAAHGYLLAQFLTPSTNLRSDKYGGSLENRARLILEIAQAIRQRTKPDFILGIKLNSVEFQDRGFQPEEARQLCAMLEEHRFDFVELSGGTYENGLIENKRASSKKRESFFLEFANMIAPALTRTRVYVTGGFRTAGAMVHALETIDGVGLARPLCQEPRFCRSLLEGKVRSAIKQRIDDQNFGLGNIAAGTQIAQIGRDQEPLDLSREENERAFLKDMATWAEKMGNDSQMVHYGYVDVISAKLLPYGTALA